MRRGVWLIWLCLALLPLRGMAHGLMLGAGASHGAAVVQTQADASAPCPMHGASMGSEAAAALPGGHGSPATAPSLASSCCHLCAVCHGAAMPALAVASIDAEPYRGAPNGRVGLGAGRVAPDGLFRPPR